VPVPSGSSDAIFLDAVARRNASLVPSVRTVERALRETIPDDELNQVGDAIRDIERQLLLPPPRTR
jgi:hypothetical protein